MSILSEAGADISKSADHTSFNITFPNVESDLDQDQEVFEYDYQGERRSMRIHDYDALFSVPGLYEALVYEKLECNSPERVVNLLECVLEDWDDSMVDLRVLDVGAGNGLVGKELKERGVPYVVGLDLLPEAAKAAARDYPEVYEDYVVGDLTDLTPEQRETLEKHKFNAMITVAALGFGDIPPDAFSEAFNFVRDEGWVVMTIKEDFLKDTDQSGFSILVREMIAKGVVDVLAHHRYTHRLSIEGERLYYVALVVRKNEDISRELLESITGASSGSSRDDEEGQGGELINNLIGEHDADGD